MARRWALVPSVVKPRTAAISLFDSPLASSSRTSIWRADKWSFLHVFAQAACEPGGQPEFAAMHGNPP